MLQKGFVSKGNPRMLRGEDDLVLDLLRPGKNDETKDLNCIETVLHGLKTLSCLNPSPSTYSFCTNHRL